MERRIEVVAVDRSAGKSELAVHTACQLRGVLRVLPLEPEYFGIRDVEIMLHPEMPIYYLFVVLLVLNHTIEQHRVALKRRTGDQQQPLPVQKPDFAFVDNLRVLRLLVEPYYVDLPALKLLETLLVTLEMDLRTVDMLDQSFLIIPDASGYFIRRQPFQQRFPLHCP